MKESEIERDARLHVEDDGHVLIKIVPVVQGWPDRCLLLNNGATAWVEFKKRKKKPEPIQLVRLAWLNNNGHIAVWVDSYAAFVSFYNWFRIQTSARLGIDRKSCPVPLPTSHN